MRRRALANQSWVEATNAYERALERDRGNDEARRGLAIANERMLPPPDRAVAAEEPPEPTGETTAWRSHIASACCAEDHVLLRLVPL